jgi:hypothetical protein
LICVTRRVAIQFFRVFVFFIVSRTSENQTVNGTAHLTNGKFVFAALFSKFNETRYSLFCHYTNTRLFFFSVVVIIKALTDGESNDPERSQQYKPSN